MQIGDCALGCSQKARNTGVSMTSRSMIFAMVMAFAISACAPNAIEAPADIDPIFFATAPPDAPPGTCWDKTITPV